jgi:hypothetical protein
MGKVSGEREGVEISEVKRVGDGGAGPCRWGTIRGDRMGGSASGEGLVNPAGRFDGRGKGTGFRSDGTRGTSKRDHQSALVVGLPLTATGGVGMTVAMPPPLGSYAAPTRRVLKPGETITLYNPEVAVESAGMLRLLGELRVDTPTTYLTPEKYRIAFGGIIQSHPKLSTGSVEFEVKDRVVWGQEVGGGTGRDRREGPPRRQAAERQSGGDHGLGVADVVPLAAGRGCGREAGPGHAAPEPSFEIIPTKLTLKPGETADLDRTDVAVEPDDLKPVNGPEAVVGTFTIQVSPGTYRAAFAGFVLDRPTLSTSTVEFEVGAPAAVARPGARRSGGRRPAAGRPRAAPEGRDVGRTAAERETVRGPPDGAARRPTRGVITGRENRYSLKPRRPGATPS